MQVTDDPRVGTELAGYRIESLLGWGGMSVVYLAEDLRLKRRVALKLLAAGLAADESLAAGVSRGTSPARQPAQTAFWTSRVPSYVEVGRQALLYFSRSSASVARDIYVSKRRACGRFGAALPVAGLNDAAANDIQPNVRKDGREVVFSSNRSGTLGSQDIWAARRDSVGDPWSAPVNLGSAVNTAASETRPSLSWQATQLLFGRTPGPEGIGDIYVSTRAR